jgi:threonine/homoserine/homoserine lactone efflux protein
MTYNDISQHLWLGFTSSFIGTLPLGMLNLTVLQLSLANRQNQAMAFSLGATVIEFVQILITLLGMNVLLPIPQLSNIFSIISIPILIYLAVQNLKKGSNTEEANPETSKGQLSPKSTFYQGIVLGFANVVVYPFWLLWGNVFVQNGWLIPTPEAYFYFSSAAAVGTLGGFFIFILLGKILWKRLTKLQGMIDKLIAFTFLGFAAFQFYTVLVK